MNTHQKPRVTPSSPSSAYHVGRAGMVRCWAVALVGAIILMGCATSQRTVEGDGVPPGHCGLRGSETDLSQDPVAVSYVRAWTNAQGCTVRRDVLAMREHGDCYPDNIREILMGTPLGQPTTPETARIYVRDPDGEENGAFSTAPLRRKVDLPPKAQDTGYRFEDMALWIVPDDSQYVYIVSPNEVEAWPVAQLPYGCA